jgi:hypothetical protein
MSAPGHDHPGAYADACLNCQLRKTIDKFLKDYNPSNFDLIDHLAQTAANVTVYTADDAGDLKTAIECFRDCYGAWIRELWPRRLERIAAAVKARMN